MHVALRNSPQAVLRNFAGKSSSNQEVSVRKPMIISRDGDIPEEKEVSDDREACSIEEPPS
jgi:hypothetical protein